MSYTTIRHQCNEFVAHDTPIEYWLYEVASHIDAEIVTDPWLDELSREWRLQATSGFEFGPSPALDKYLSTDSRRKQLANYFRTALESLSQKSDIIQPAELNSLEIGGKAAIYNLGLPTQAVIEVGKQFLNLIS
jgi:hypothetical protein